MSERKWFESLATFDLETTGVDTRSSRIVSASLVTIDANGSATASTSWLADPEIEIPHQATAVHGITTERARREGRNAREVVGEIIEAISSVLTQNMPLVVFNAPYDLSLLANEARRHGLEPILDPRPIVDPLVIDREFNKFRRGKRTLEVLTEIYNVSLGEAHVAAEDAIAAARLAQAFASQIRDLRELSAEELHEKQISWSKEQSASFAEYMRRTKNPNFNEEAGWPIRLSP